MQSTMFSLSDVIAQRAVMPRASAATPRNPKMKGIGEISTCSAKVDSQLLPIT